MLHVSRARALTCTLHLGHDTMQWSQSFNGMADVRSDNSQMTDPPGRPVSAVFFASLACACADYKLSSWKNSCCFVVGALGEARGRWTRVDCCCSPHKEFHTARTNSCAGITLLDSGTSRANDVAKRSGAMLIQSTPHAGNRTRTTCAQPRAIRLFPCGTRGLGFVRRSERCPSVYCQQMLLMSPSASAAQYLQSVLSSALTVKLQ